MVGYIIDTLLILAAFALQIHLPARLTAIAGALVAACLVVQLTVGRDDDNYFFVFVIMTAIVVALIARGIRGQIRRRAAFRLTGRAAD